MERGVNKTAKVFFSLNNFGAHCEVYYNDGTKQIYFNVILHISFKRNVLDNLIVYSQRHIDVDNNWWRGGGQQVGSE